MSRHCVACVFEIPEGAGREFLLAGQVIAIWRIRDRFYATQARCPHSDAPLCAGDLDGPVVTCPMHQWQFDVTTGRGVNPADQAVRTYPVWVEGDQVYVEA
jgi:nitrite reductase/ring-hydroxylating ferredoxin subunit